MQNDQAHAFEDPFLNPLNDLVLHLGVRGVTPPDQNVCLQEARLRQTMFRFLQGGGTCRQIAGRETFRDAVVHSVRVDFSNGLRPLFMNIFAPDHDSDIAHTYMR